MSDEPRNDLLPHPLQRPLPRDWRHSRKRPVGLSSGLVPIATMLSALHLFNYINYTTLAGYFNPPAMRSALLVAFSLYLLVFSYANLKFHFLRSWDMYLICLLALFSTAYSTSPATTSKYAVWLTLSVYVGTELAARTRTARDAMTALCIVLLPASFLVATVNLTLGPTVEVTGRHFGALGSKHVDTAYAMNFICLFFALRAVPENKPHFAGWLRIAMWAVLAWSIYQAVFGLTRSVWIGVTVTLLLYYFRHKLTLASLVGAALVTTSAIVIVGAVGIDRIVPEAVIARVQVTEQGYQSGHIDPRVEGIKHAWRYSFEHPLGSGYVTEGSHNSYMNILLGLGWHGFLLSLFAIVRSIRLVLRMGFAWSIVFAIGSVALLLHAFFEVQDMPGQSNFIPLLLWYALSRSRFVGNFAPAARRRSPALG